MPPLPCPAALSSSLLYRSPDGATVILDIPRSLEESQVRAGDEPSARCRIYSSPAPTAPFETPEPAHGVGPPEQAAAQIDALMTAESLRRTLKTLSQNYAGAYCLPRHIAPQSSSSPSSSPSSSQVVESEPYIPPGATHIQGSIHQTVPSLLKRCASNTFHLIVMDPPWPNRSVRRATTSATARYKTAGSLSAVGELLRAIPVPALLRPDGLVAVWVTNKSRIVDLLGRILAAWGLQVVAEWTWLKVTTDGRPLYPLDSVWRKPWEKLLVARPVGPAAAPARPAATVTPRTIVAVPDVHSRKPNLRALFGDLFEPGYSGLEVFARGLTAGWCSWGDEVLKFQQPQHWHTTQNQ
ncbi:hypothetical protein V2A60_001812 [Cordyceps javanica]|uniref:MT-A70 family n=1 Tax=Cordyceps javanica TaxID=43265 RepID=A0A545WD81_9HYPO|nr:MT-A70 family [Cordyceps javanica]TQW11943.1 MT-A70 family [Cordyceps javanica]